MGTPIAAWIERFDSKIRGFRLAAALTLMPWKPTDAHGHTHRANSATAQRQWAHVANAELERTGDEAVAIRAANAVVKKRKRGGRTSVAAMMKGET